MNLVELQNKIHQQNVELGWWDEERPFSTFVCLFHSELSEAMEGDRKGLKDDHLPQYEMFWVELADFVIRCLDWLGSKSVGSDEWDKMFVVLDKYTKTEFLSDMHKMVSESLSSNQDGFWSDRDDCLIDSVKSCLEFASSHRVDLHKIILEKVEYNKHRADHKRENRAKAGGKKY